MEEIKPLRESTSWTAKDSTQPDDDDDFREGIFSNSDYSKMHVNINK